MTRVFEFHGTVQVLDAFQHFSKPFLFLLLQRVFELHGAVQVHVPQLLPRSSLRIHERTEKLVVTMTKSGDVVCLPFDLVSML